MTQLETFHARGVAVADLDGDGNPEVIFASQGQDSGSSGAFIYWGAAEASTPPTPDTAAGNRYRGRRRSDCDGDGRLDVLVANEARVGSEDERARPDTDYPLASTIYWNSLQGSTPPGGPIFRPPGRVTLRSRT